MPGAKKCTASAQRECLKHCQFFQFATGCEVIWNQGNRGCYAHTKEVARGNGHDNHFCWVFSKCKVHTGEQDFVVKNKAVHQFPEWANTGGCRPQLISADFNGDGSTDLALIGRKGCSWTTVPIALSNPDRHHGGSFHVVNHHVPHPVGETQSAPHDAELTIGDRFIQVGPYWRLGDVDGKHFSIAYMKPNDKHYTAVIFRSDGTVHNGPRSDFSLWHGNRATKPQGVVFGENVIQIGEWRVGATDEGHFSFSHKDGKTAMILRYDGTVHPGPRDDFSTFAQSTAKTNVQFADRAIQFGNWRLGDLDGTHFSISWKTLRNGERLRLYLHVCSVLCVMLLSTHSITIAIATTFMHAAPVVHAHTHTDHRAMQPQMCCERVPSWHCGTGPTSDLSAWMRELTTSTPVLRQRTALCLQGGRMSCFVWYV